MTSCVTLADKETQISGNSSSFHDQLLCSDYSNKDCELDGPQDMIVDDEQINESTETLLDHQPLIDPICK